MITGEVTGLAMRGNIMITALMDQLTLNPGTEIIFEKDVTLALLEDNRGDPANVPPRVNTATVHLILENINNLFKSSHILQNDYLFNSLIMFNIKSSVPQENIAHILQNNHFLLKSSIIFMKNVITDY